MTKSKPDSVPSKIAIYPGSFDPVTNGHIDIVERGMEIFDKVIVTILHNPNKKALFNPDERKEMLQASLPASPQIEVAYYDGLLVDFAESRGASVILRGLRVLSDFDYEFQLALMNRRLNRNVQTVFLMTGMRWVFISSSIVKQAAQFGGHITGLVPPIVEKKMREKFSNPIG